MTSQNKELSWLLSEKNLSDTMTAFYTAIIKADENSKLLLTEDPWEINPSQFGGNQETREKMSRFCEFLELIQIITKDEEIYKDQFLKPFQMIARELMETRSGNNQNKSSDLDGWIFSKSRPTITSSFSKRFVINGAQKESIFILWFFLTI